MKAGAPVFYLVDTHGILYAAAEFIIEDLGPHSIDELLQLNSPEKQHQWICRYLQERLDQATPYQVHVERFKNKPVIRFGGYGLKGGGGLWDFVSSFGPNGGGRPWESMMLFVYAFAVVCFGLKRNRNSAWYASLTTTLSGMYLFTTQGNPFARLIGTCLASAGISGGAYAYFTENTSYKTKEFFKQSGYGVLTGSISAIGGMVAQGSRLLSLGSQVVGNAAGNAAVAAFEPDEENQNSGKKVVKRTIAGALGGGAGTPVSMAAHHVMSEYDIGTPAYQWI